MEIEISEGYKKTDVGVLPVDWEVYNLCEISERITDGEHATPKRTNEGYYLLSARNVHDGRIDLTDVDFVDIEEYHRIRKRCNPETGDVLISCSGTIGRVAVLSSGIECVMVRSAALMKPDRANTNSYFIQYVLQSIVGQTQIAKSINQGAQANLFINHIEKLKIPFPPLPEQKAIAQALSDVDVVIAELHRLITKKHNIKQGAMQELLTGKKRLPGFTDVWDKVTLGQLGVFSKGFGIKKDQVSDYGFPCIRYGEIYTKYNDYIRKFYSFISEAIASESQLLTSGNLLFAGSGETAEEIGKCVAFLGNEEAYAGGDIIIFTPKEQNSMFLAYLMNYESIVKQKSRMGQGDAVVHIQAKNLAQLQFNLPSVEEQTAIAQILSDMDADIEGLEQKRDKYKAIKQGMMQELLTGRTRLV